MPMRYRTCWGLGAKLMMALLLLALGGCAAQQAAKTKLVRPVWPPPPQKTRIEFVRTIASNKDIKHDTTFTRKVINFLAGYKPPPKHLVEPMGIAVSDNGKVLYVSDLTQSAVFVFDFGHKSFRKIGPLSWPVGLALDSHQDLYVVEQYKRGISEFNPQGKRIRFITDKSLQRPTGIVIDRKRQRLYVADTGHTKSKEHVVDIFSLTSGKLIGRVGHGKGSAPGQFLFPTYLAVDRTGNLYVTDSMNCRVQVFNPEGKLLRVIGRRGDAWGMFSMPKGVAVDDFGNVYVADSIWGNVQIFNHKGRILLFFGGRGPLPGMLRNPTAVAIDRHNDIYVGDFLNHRVDEYRLVNTTAADSYAASQTPRGGDAKSKAQQVAKRTGKTVQVSN